MEPSPLDLTASTHRPTMYHGSNIDGATIFSLELLPWFESLTILRYIDVFDIHIINNPLGLFSFIFKLFIYFLPNLCGHK